MKFQTNPSYFRYLGNHPWVMKIKDWKMFTLTPLAYMSLIMGFQFFIYQSWLIYSQEHKVKTVDYHTLNFDFCNRFNFSADECMKVEDTNDDVLNYMSVLPGEYKKWIVLGTALIMMSFHILYHQGLRLNPIKLNDFLLGPENKDHRSLKLGKKMLIAWNMFKIMAFSSFVGISLALCIPKTYDLLKFNHIQTNESGSRKFFKLRSSSSSSMI